MSTKTKLLKYQNEMDQIDKDVQRTEGSLENEFESLSKDLDIKGKPDKLIKETKKMIKKIDNQANENEIKLDELMEEIDTKYKEFEEEE